MRRLRALVVGVLFLSCSAVSTQAAEPPKPQLPKVVLIGDSIRLGYTPTVKKLLYGKAAVVSPGANGQDSRNVLKKLDEWAIREQPTIVVFNCGIHDTKKFKTTGQFQVPPQAYEENLRAIVKRLREGTKAVVLFATTTPILSERAAAARSDRDYELLGESVVQYNQIAVRVMNELKVPVLDLHGFLSGSQSPAPVTELIVADGVHYTSKGQEALGKAVAEFLSKQLAELPKSE